MLWISRSTTGCAAMPDITQSLAILTILLQSLMGGVMNARFNLSAPDTTTYPARYIKTTKPFNSITEIKTTTWPDRAVEKNAASMFGINYESSVCPFRFDPPAGWTILDHPGSETNEFFSSAPWIELSNDNTRMTIACNLNPDDPQLLPAGFTRGSIVAITPITFLKETISGYAYQADQQTEKVIYLYTGEDLHAAIILEALTSSSTIHTSSMAAAIPLLQTFSLTPGSDLSLASKTAPPNQIILPMLNAYHSQIYETQLPNACGPAVVLIALDYMGIPADLSEVIADFRSVPPEAGGYDPACRRNYVCTSPMTLAEQLGETYGIIAHPHTRWTFEEIHAALTRGNPVVADILWLNNTRGLGHFIVIYGIDLEKKLLFYHDPYFGAHLSSSWEQISSRWIGPVDPRDPLNEPGYSFWGMEIQTAFMLSPHFSQAQ